MNNEDMKTLLAVTNAMVDALISPDEAVLIEDILGYINLYALKRVEGKFPESTMEKLLLLIKRKIQSYGLYMQREVVDEITVE